MTNEDIQKYIEKAIGSHFDGITSESGEMMTSEGGDGRFLGKVYATRYSGLPEGKDVFLVVGQSEKKVQVVKFGKTESLTPSKVDLDLMLLKELRIKVDA